MDTSVGQGQHNPGPAPAPDGATALTAEIMTEAVRLGFELAGVVQIGGAQEALAAARYRAWLEKGFHGEMSYLARPDAVAKREDLSLIQPGARSVLVVGANYYTALLSPELTSDRSRGLLARYAWGQDYHDLLLPRLRQLAVRVEGLVGVEPAGAAGWRAYVDTGPVLERDLAVRAGLGFTGKNTCLISPRLGSWLFLGEVLINHDLSRPAAPPPGPTLQKAVQGTCGGCTRCLDACPTGALVAPYQLDARRCISYLTIELKGPIPRILRPLMGNRIFGCDICQEVCPWNRRFAQITAEPSFQPGENAMTPPLLDLIALDDESFGRRFRKSPVKRAKRRGLLRNVAVALGNWGDPAAVPALSRALYDGEPLVRGHAAWALGRMDGGAGSQALQAAQRSETEDWVREEIDHSLVKLFP